MQRGIISIFLTGLTIFMGCPVLHALTPMEYLRRHVNPVNECGDDGLLFHTDEGRVLILTDTAERIGAILVHTKKRTQQARELVDKILPLVKSDEDPTISYSRDGYSALVLYEDIAEDVAGDDESVIEINRLGAIYNICNKEDAEWTPHRWHDGGISFRYYEDGNLAAEITPDLTEETVNYAEIRISDDYRSLIPTSLAGHNHKAPSNKTRMRQLSSELGNATILSSDSFGSTHVTRRKDVCCAGTTARLRKANKNRRDMSHYIFPDFDFPRQKATITTPSLPSVKKPVPVLTTKKDPTPPEKPATPEKKQQPTRTYTPEQARKAYIDYLNQLR